MTTPDGEIMDIAVEFAPLIKELRRLGFTIKPSCLDGGEALIHGGTRAHLRLTPAHVHPPDPFSVMRSGPRRALPTTLAPDAWISVAFPHTDIGLATAWSGSIALMETVVPGGDDANETREFPLYSVIGVISDLPQGLDDYMGILMWMVGEHLSIITAMHAKVACAQWIRVCHPPLRSISEKSGFKAGDDEADTDAWVARLTCTLRDPMPVQKLPADRWNSPSDLDGLERIGALHKTYIIPDMNP
ncbi:hypothetical protein [Actinomadura litoris]|uniref:hypothetical protein n=1 Tax=Actinomadura litoris TaxID=2678616 RepID=UPI001FA6CBF2|nr:hypothetical protein [Actinomadura litoris]